MASGWSRPCGNVGRLLKREWQEPTRGSVRDGEIQRELPNSLSKSEKCKRYLESLTGGI